MVVKKVCDSRYTRSSARVRDRLGSIIKQNEQKIDLNFQLVLKWEEPKLEAVGLARVLYSYVMFLCLGLYFPLKVEYLFLFFFFVLNMDYLSMEIEKILRIYVWMDW